MKLRPLAVGFIDEESSTYSWLVSSPSPFSLFLSERNAAKFRDFSICLSPRRNSAHKETFLSMSSPRRPSPLFSFSRGTRLPARPVLPPSPLGCPSREQHPSIAFSCPRRSVFSAWYTRRMQARLLFWTSKRLGLLLPFPLMFSLFVRRRRKPLFPFPSLLAPYGDRDRNARTQHVFPFFLLPSFRQLPRKDPSYGNP